ncbi:hypothetical protein FB446DRAFT_728628 [Lentinula raphanica]|nr:hypothetical protein FB446DRAFT_728628 [Lentinula raphanica]
MMFLPVVWEGHGQNGYYSLSYRTKVSEVSTEHMMGPLYQWGPNTNGERISLDDYPKLLVLGTVTMTLNLKRDVMEDVNTAVTENRINELPNLLSLFQYQSLIKKELDDRSRDPVRSSSIRGIAFDLSRYQVLHKRMLEEMGTAAGSIIAETMLWEWYLYRSILARQLDIAQSLDDKNRDILLHMDHLYDPKVWPSQTSASSSKNPENGLSHRT